MADISYSVSVRARRSSDYLPYLGFDGLAFATAALASDPVELATFAGLQRPAPTAQLSYGASPSQGIDIFLPSGAGLHPTAILIHGGCWRDLPSAGRDQLRHLGADLAARGIAAWSVGYRRADEPGGGYPGTFQDVGRAIDRLRSEATRYHLDSARTVIVGDSAGGHLALWASARMHLPQDSSLYQARPFVPAAVISLARVGDLKTFSPSVISSAQSREPLTPTRR